MPWSHAQRTRRSESRIISTLERYSSNRDETSTDKDESEGDPAVFLRSSRRWRFSAEDSNERKALSPSKNHWAFTSMRSVTLLRSICLMKCFSSTFSWLSNSWTERSMVSLDRSSVYLTQSREDEHQPTKTDTGEDDLNDHRVDETGIRIDFDVLLFAFDTDGMCSTDVHSSRKMKIPLFNKKNVRDEQVDLYFCNSLLLHSEEWRSDDTVVSWDSVVSSSSSIGDLHRTAERSVSLLVENDIHSDVEERALVDKETSERESKSAERSTGCSRAIDRFALQSRRTDREEREGNHSSGIFSLVLRWEAISTADQRTVDNASVSTDRRNRLWSTSVAREKHSFVDER